MSPPQPRTRPKCPPVSVQKRFEHRNRCFEQRCPGKQELYGIRYALRTLDVDFAVHVAHRQNQLRADLKQLITDLGFADCLAADPYPLIRAPPATIRLIWLVPS
jgi:hypothetical protein